jgi:hypothetical protein
VQVGVRIFPRLLAELHRDSSYLMIEKTLGWLGLTEGKPQGRGLGIWGVASGSAASHPDPGNSCLVEFREESRSSRPVPRVQEFKSSRVQGDQAEKVIRDPDTDVRSVPPGRM